jgi:hypothetical protein
MNLLKRNAVFTGIRLVSPKLLGVESRPMGHKGIQYVPRNSPNNDIPKQSADLIRQGNVIGMKSKWTKERECMGRGKMWTDIELTCSPVERRVSYG